MHWTTFTQNIRNFYILKNLPQTIFCLLPDGRKIAKMSLKNDILTCLVRSKKLFWGHHWGWPNDFTPKCYESLKRSLGPQKGFKTPRLWQLEPRFFKIFRILKIGLRWVFSIVKIPQIWNEDRWMHAYSPVKIRKWSVMWGKFHMPDYFTWV